MKSLPVWLIRLTLALFVLVVGYFAWGSFIWGELERRIVDDREHWEHLHAAAASFGKAFGYENTVSKDVQIRIIDQFVWRYTLIASFASAMLALWLFELWWGRRKNAP